MILLGGVALEFMTRNWAWNRIVCTSVSGKAKMPYKRYDRPLGLLDRSMSRTMSMDWSISSTHSPPSGQTGRTSIAMLCQEESNTLCPSSRLAMPAFPLQGSSFKNGVRFSVHTTSRGSVPCSRCKFETTASEWSPSSWNDIVGRIVRVASMKLSEAQNKPDKAFVRVSHLLSALWDMS